MQGLGWYIRRLRTMSPGEVCWRVGSIVRDGLDRIRYPLRRAGWGLPTAAPRAAPAEEFHLLDGWAGQPGSPPSGFSSAWRDPLVSQADAIAAGRLSFFDLEAASLGDPIDWNRDHKRDLATPTGFAPAIDYRDVRLAGDCKFVWEPSRHHQLVVLGRAYRVTGRQEYARAVVRQIEGWIDQCPFGTGMQWRSPMELAIRLINWVWALDLIGPSGLVAGKVASRVRRSVYLHLWDITRKYSRHSSANNHTIGEAAGVYLATAYFADLPHAERWRKEARVILAREILQQTNADGGGREQAVGYQLFIAQFLLLAGLAARRGGEDFPDEYWRRLEKLFEFLAALVEGGDHVPAFGDGDDGYVLDLGVGPGGYRQWIGAAAVAFERADFARAAGEFPQTAWWLFGPAGGGTFARLLDRQTDQSLRSRAFTETGLYLLQAGHLDRDDRISVSFDCGPHGLEPLTAHGHADALSFTLRAFGVDVLVDPGTYDYFSYRPWREHFRGTRAHNTVEIDGQEQSEPRGLFLWGRRAASRCLDWNPSADGVARVTGEHDGYARLADPVIHRRTLERSATGRELRVQDALLAGGRHEAAVWFHLAEQCRVKALGQNRFEIDAGRGTVTLEIDPKLSVEQFAGSESPIAGWVSRGYHRKSAAVSLVGRCAFQGETALECRLTIHSRGL